MRNENSNEKKIDIPLNNKLGHLKKNKSLQDSRVVSDREGKSQPVLVEVKFASCLKEVRKQPKWKMFSIWSIAGKEDKHGMLNSVL